jgi:hypothetical protein
MFEVLFGYLEGAILLMFVCWLPSIIQEQVEGLAVPRTLWGLAGS